MKVLKKIWKGIRFGIGVLFAIPFLISMCCMYLFGITVAIFDYSIINKIAEKFSIVNDKVENKRNTQILVTKKELEDLIVELEKLKEALNDRVA
jgi:hypothetical protein